MGYRLKGTEDFSDGLSDQLTTDAFADVRAPLARSKKVRQQDRRSAMTKAARLLRRSRQRVQKWPDSGHRQALAIGLRRVFKKGRTTFAETCKQPSVETFHEWRKEVKHLLYQTRLLKPLWPMAMKGLADELKTLSQYLSEDHDLAILRAKVTEQLEKSKVRTQIEALAALVDQRRNELQLCAKVLGARVYAEKPRAFVGRLETYWQAWRTEVKDDPILLGQDQFN
jgi:CHAD domain-containing protein